MASRKRRESFEMALARVIALDELPEKECTKCGEVKSPAAFSAKPDGRFGLQSLCKACDAEAKKARQATYRAHNATRNPYSDPTRKRCSDCKQLLPRTDYPQNRAMRDGLHPQCRECTARRSRKWRLTNPDRRRELTRAVMRRRRARKRQNGTVPYREEDIFAASDYLCVYCGAPAEEIEHFVPISRGGADAPWNVVATCVACNRGPGGKFVRDPIEFLISRGIHIARVIVEHACGEVEEIPLRDTCADEH